MGMRGQSPRPRVGLGGEGSLRGRFQWVGYALFWGVCVGWGAWKYFGGCLTRVFLTWNVKFCGDELLPLFSCNGVVVWREGFFFHENILAILLPKKILII